MAAPGIAAECTTRSGPLRNPLVEVYTSEGCSSCPPADRWLSSLAAGVEPSRLVPIAFHVDYWDDIGWKDPFAQRRFTERQRAVTAAAGGRFVYTPQVLVDGGDFGPRWREPGALGVLAAAAKRPAPLALEIARSEERGAVLARVKVDPAAGGRDKELVLVVAMTQSGLASKVTAGENRGAMLRHDFVARDIATVPMRGEAEYRVRFEPGAGWAPAEGRLIAFVQDRASGRVLQAVSACRSR